MKLPGRFVKSNQSEPPRSAAGRAVSAAFNPTVALLRNATAEAQRSRLPQMAAALSYRTVFGLIPVMVVALVAMKMFFTTDNEIADVLNQGLRYSGLSSIAAPAPPEVFGPPAPPGESTGEMVPAGEAAKPIGPEAAGATASANGGPPPPAVNTAAQERLDGWIKDLVSRASSVNFQAIGLIGAVALLYAAISMLVEVERAFNQIYRVPSGRSWLRRFVNYWALLCFGGVGLFLSFLVTRRFSAELLRVASYAGADNNSAVLLAAAGYISTVMISTALFMLVYTVVPNTRVKPGPAAAGAFIAALLWEAGKWGFTQYLSFSTGYAKLYGSIALVPLFLLWVYVTWCIVLFGLNIAYYLQHGRYRTAPQPSELLAPAIVDPAATLAIMAAMARRFESGQPADAPALAQGLSIQPVLAAQMLERLSEAGLIHRVHGDGDGRFVLSRPPERIDAAEVVKIGEELLGPAAEAGNPVLQTMREARAALVRGRTLASFLVAPLPEAARIAAPPASASKPAEPGIPLASPAPRPKAPPAPAQTPATGSAR